MLLLALLVLLVLALLVLGLLVLPGGEQQAVGSARSMERGKHWRWHWQIRSGMVMRGDAPRIIGGAVWRSSC